MADARDRLLKATTVPTAEEEGVHEPKPHIESDTLQHFVERMAARHHVSLIAMALNAPSASDFARAAMPPYECSASPCRAQRLWRAAAVVFRVVPFAILTIQITLMCMIVLGVYRAHSSALACPSRADVLSRIAAGCVALLYFTRFCLNLLTLLSEAFVPPRRVVVAGMVLEDNFAGATLFGSLMDCIISLTINHLIYFVNLYVIFFSTSAQDVIFHSLAAEWIAHLDDAWTAAVLREHPVYARHLVMLDMENAVRHRAEGRAYAHRDWLMLLFHVVPIVLVVPVAAYVVACM